MLRFRNVSRTFHSGRDQWRFGPVNERIMEGESVAVSGKSGSGKSTFLHLAGGLLFADEGAVLFLGKDIGRFSEKQRAEFRNRQIGFVFQDFFLFEEFTLLENVAMPLFIRGIGRKTACNEALLSLEATGLSGKENHFPSQLSGGQRQRAAIARALVGKPRLLLADEPTGNLDGQTGEEIIALLFRLQKQAGLTLVLVTHDQELARRANRQVHIEDGKMIDVSLSPKR